MIAEEHRQFEDPSSLSQLQATPTKYEAQTFQETKFRNLTAPEHLQLDQSSSILPTEGDDEQVDVSPESNNGRIEAEKEVQQKINNLRGPPQRKQVKTIFHQVLAKESDNCDYITDSIVSSSGPINAGLMRYEPPEKLSANICLQDPTNYNIQEDQQLETQQQIEGFRQETATPEQSYSRNNNFYEMTTYENDAEDNNVEESDDNDDQQRIVDQDLDRSQSSEQGDNNGDQTQVSQNQRSDHGNKKQYPTTRQPNRLTDFLQPVLNSQNQTLSSSAQQSKVTSSKISKSSRGHRLFQKLTTLGQSSSGQVHTLEGLQSLTHKTSTDKQQLYSRQPLKHTVVQKGIAQQSQVYTAQRGSMGSAMGSNKVSLMSPLTKFLAPRRSQATSASHQNNMVGNNQGQKETSVSQFPDVEKLKGTTDKAKRHAATNKDPMPFKQSSHILSFKQQQLQASQKASRGTSSTLAYTQNYTQSSVPQSQVKQVSQVLQLQKSKLQSLLIGQSQMKLASQSQATLEPFKTTVGKQCKRDTNRAKQLSKNPHQPGKSPSSTAILGKSHTKAHLLQHQTQTVLRATMQQNYTQQMALTQEVQQKPQGTKRRTLKPSNSMIVSMLNSTFKQQQSQTNFGTGKPPVDSNQGQTNPGIKRQKTFSYNQLGRKPPNSNNLLRGAKMHYNNPHHAMVMSPQNSQSAMKNFKKISQSSRSVSAKISINRSGRKGDHISSDGRHQYMLRGSFSAQKKSSTKKQRRAKDVNEFNLDNHYITPDAVEISKQHQKKQKSSAAQNDQPIQFIQTTPARSSKASSAQHRQQSPKRSHPVLYLDLANEPLDQSSSSFIANKLFSPKTKEILIGSKEQQENVLSDEGEQSPKNPFISIQETTKVPGSKKDTDVQSPPMRKDVVAKNRGVKTGRSPTGGVISRQSYPLQPSSQTTFIQNNSSKHTMSLKKMQTFSHKKQSKQQALDSKMSSKRTSLIGNQNQKEVFGGHLMSLDDLAKKKCSSNVEGIFISDPASFKVNKQLFVAQQKTTQAQIKRNNYLASTQNKKSPRINVLQQKQSKNNIAMDSNVTPVQLNQQLLNNNTMMYNNGMKFMQLPPTGGQRGQPKFISSSTASGNYATTLPKHTSSNLGYKQQPATAAGGTRPTPSMHQPSSQAIKQRRKVTDVSFLKNGSSRALVSRTSAGMRSVSKNKTGGVSKSQAVSGGPTEGGQYGQPQQETAAALNVDPAKQIKAENRFLQLLDQADGQRQDTVAQQKRERSRDRSAVRDRSGIRATSQSQQQNRFSNPTVNGQSTIQRQMIDQMMMLQRKNETSEYNASNLTSITEYQIGKHLGQGAYASVKQAMHLQTGLVLAIKVYEKFNLMDQSRKKSVVREINVLKKLQHKNIMRLYDVIDTPRQLYLIMEYIQGTQLNNYLQSLPTKNQAYQLPIEKPIGSNQAKGKSKQTLEQEKQSMLISQQLGAINSGTVSEEVAGKIMSQILSALSFMHARNICHRDMKPDNIIFNPTTGQIKLIDFGFACISREKLRVFCGTPSFMSPEIVSKKDYSGDKADVWASGIILYALLTGTVPFKAQNEKDLWRKIQRGAYTYCIQTYAQMVAQKNAATSQAATFNTSLQPQAFRQNSGAQVLMTSTNEGKSTPTPPQQQVIQVSSEAKSLIKLMLTVSESHRPSALDILVSSPWIQDHMSSDEIESLQTQIVQQTESY